MKTKLFSLIVFFITLNIASNPISSDNFLYLIEEQVWIEVGVENSSISGTFFFKLGKHARNIYTFYVPVYIPLDWNKEKAKKKTKLKFTVKNTVITKKIIDKKPRKISNALFTPDNQKIIWYEVKTTKFIGAKTAGVEFANKNDKNNVIHSKRGKLLWREKNSSIPPIKISYIQQTYKENNNFFFIYMPLMTNNTPHTKGKEYGFIRIRPKKGHTIELGSELPKDTWKKIDGDILVSPKNRKAIIISIKKTITN